ncbi:MAG TPA: WYL domain-containing protein, partial [Candidatus Eremiobacteraceae bacterium]|nr:WYL domain-containing protein [Candidatus Eremiobacteraceae bacterium]
TPGYTVVLDVSPDAIDDVTAYWESEALPGAQRRSRRSYRIVFPSKDVALAHVFMWHDRVEVVEPAELVEAIAVRARHAIARYREKRAG